MLVDYTPAETMPDLDGSGGTGPLQTYQDGDVVTMDGLMTSTSAKRGLIGKLINGLYYTARKGFGLQGGTRTLATLAELAVQTLGASGGKLVGVSGSVGAGMTLPTGTLQALADWLADHVPALSTLADTTAPSGAALIGIDAYSGGPLGTISAGTLRAAMRTMADTLWDLSINIPTATGRTATTLTASSTTVTIDASKPLWIHKYSGADGTTVNCTASNYAGSAPANPEIELLVACANGTNGSAVAYHVKNAGGSDLCLINFGDHSGAYSHAASVKLRWSGAAWQLFPPVVAGTGLGLSTSDFS